MTSPSPDDDGPDRHFASGGRRARELERTLHECLILISHAPMSRRRNVPRAPSGMVGTTTTASAEIASLAGQRFGVYLAGAVQHVPLWRNR